MEYYCYLYTDPSRNEPIYVGKGKGQRVRKHLEPRHENSHLPFYRRLTKMKREGIVPVITFLAKDVDEELASLCEVMAIEKYGRKDLGKGPLLNLTDGGEGISGRKNTDETKARMSMARRNRGTVKTGPISETRRAAITKSINEMYARKRAQKEQ